MHYTAILCVKARLQRRIFILQVLVVNLNLIKEIAEALEIASRLWKIVIIEGLSTLFGHEGCHLVLKALL